MSGLLKRREAFQVKYVNCHKLIKEESVTKNNLRISGIKTPHESKIVVKAGFPKFTFLWI